MTRMKSPPQILVNLRFTGRFTPGVEPTGPDFRAEFDLGVPGTLNMVYVELDLPPVSSVEANASVWLLAPEFQAGRLYAGMPFKAFGRTEVIGEGTILSVMDGALQHGA